MSEICSHYMLAWWCLQGCGFVFYICPHGFGTVNTISICTLGNLSLWRLGRNTDCGLFQFYLVPLINHIYICFYILPACRIYISSGWPVSALQLLPFMSDDVPPPHSNVFKRNHLSLFTLGFLFLEKSAVEK